MTTATLVKCVHGFNIDKKMTGTCRYCGEVRQFDSDGRQPPKLVKAGNPLLAHNPDINKTETTSSPTAQTEKNINQSVKQDSTIQPTPINKVTRHEYFEANKEQILNDLKILGNGKTKKKWDICASTFVGLKRRWLGEESVNKKYKRHTKNTKNVEKIQIEKPPEPKPIEPEKEKTIGDLGDVLIPFGLTIPLIPVPIHMPEKFSFLITEADLAKMSNWECGQIMNAILYIIKARNNK